MTKKETQINIKDDEQTDPETAATVLSEFIKNGMEDAPNLKLPSPNLRDYYKDEKNRIIWINTEIDNSTLFVNKRILEYNKADRGIPVEERKPIRIFIDTNGGSVTVMWSIIQAIKLSKTPVYTINFCEALSAGSYILAAGHKRFAMPGSTVLIHSGSCTYSGTQEAVDNTKKYYDALGKKADEQLLKDTKIQQRELKRKAAGDWYLSDTECLAKGVVDKIIENFDELY